MRQTSSSATDQACAVRLLRSSQPVLPSTQRTQQPCSVATMHRPDRSNNFFHGRSNNHHRHSEEKPTAAPGP